MLLDRTLGNTWEHFLGFRSPGFLSSSLTTSSIPDGLKLTGFRNAKCLLGLVQFGDLYEDIAVKSQKPLLDGCRICRTNRERRGLGIGEWGNGKCGHWGIGGRFGHWGFGH